MYSEMKGKTALITGAGKETGIGYTIAKRLADEGVTVVISDVCKDIGADNYARIGTKEELESLAKKINGHCVVIDVTDEGTIAAAAAYITDTFGRLDYLINNAGASPSPQYLQYMDLAMWQKTIDIGLNGTLLVTRHMLPLMTGGGCAIVNTASRAGKKPRAFAGAYCVAKAGVIMMTKVFAMETAALGIRVNAICPGQIDTDLERWGWEYEAQIRQIDVQEIIDEEITTIPAGRIGLPKDVADLVAFLLSDQARYITGQALNIDGGQLMEL
ncbi:MAG: SDR family oxidoreductase [Deltaproteobacteria bacterium]|nr:SDR family oxidoreductase [Candidatus Zymogenaceae bacterium]